MLRAVCASEPNQPGWLASPYLGLIIFVHVLLVCGLLYVALAPACLPACLLLCSHAAGQAKAGGKGPYGPTHPRLFGWPEQTPPPHTFASRRRNSFSSAHHHRTCCFARVRRERVFYRATIRSPPPAGGDERDTSDNSILFLRAVQNETLKY
jgi:hypothetical protein